MTDQQQEHPEAAEELDATVAWYEEHEPGTGLTLIDRAVEARQSIAAWPQAARPFPGWTDQPVVRSQRVRGYPYRIVYVIDNDGLVLILAYAHHARRPGCWMHRLDTPPP
ncbi:MAG: type II toxin-antitoxin system RelE/ParE family toxin [Micrococcales bacterium]|nr:type II toxin-antitoxin system RelE/ParE family toxin [Micrococcales bacterium]